MNLTEEAREKVGGFFDSIYDHFYKRVKERFDGEIDFGMYFKTRERKMTEELSDQWQYVKWHPYRRVIITLAYCG